MVYNVVVSTTMIIRTQHTHTHHRHRHRPFVRRNPVLLFISVRFGYYHTVRRGLRRCRCRSRRMETNRIQMKQGERKNYVIKEKRCVDIILPRKSNRILYFK